VHCKDFNTQLHTLVRSDETDFLDKYLNPFLKLQYLQLTGAISSKCPQTSSSAAINLAHMKLRVNVTRGRPQKDFPFLAEK